MKKTEIPINKPVSSGLSTLGNIKTVMHEFGTVRYNYLKPKYGKKINIMLHGYSYLYSLHKNR